MATTVFMINPAVFGGEVAPQRYWRISFTERFGGDVFINRIAVFKDGSGPDLAFEAETITDSGGISGTQAQRVARLGPNLSSSYSDVTPGSPPFNFDFDFGSGQETIINQVLTTCDTSTVDMLGDFEVYYSSNGVDWTFYWDSGNSIASTDFPSFPSSVTRNVNHPAAAPDEAEGVIVRSAQGFAVIGRPAAGISVQNAQAYAVVGTRPDGPSIVDNTTYAVVTP